MATTTTRYLDFPGLGIYDAQLKTWVTGKVADLANGAVKANTDAIAVLNGGAEIEGSVAKQVADAIAQIIADAPESFDTLKEISDWISTHTDDASAMNTLIQDNKKAIADLAKLVGTLPEGLDPSIDTIIKYIDKMVGDVDFSGEIAAALAEAKGYTDSEIAALSAEGGAIKANADAIAALDTRVQELEAISPITKEEIDSLFAAV